MRSMKHLWLFHNKCMDVRLPIGCCTSYLIRVTIVAHKGHSLSVCFIDLVNENMFSIVQPTLGWKVEN